MSTTGVATSVLRAPGIVGGGGSFDGSSSYVSFSNQSNFIAPSAITEELWLKKSGSGGLGYIFQKYYDGNTPIMHPQPRMSQVSSHQIERWFAEITPKRIRR